MCLYRDTEYTFAYIMLNNHFISCTNVHAFYIKSSYVYLLYCVQEKEYVPNIIINIQI